MASTATVIEWRTHPFRAERWLEAWLPAAERAMSFGASGWTLTRSQEDPLHFRQTIFWEGDGHIDFERYWASDEVTAIREQVMNYYNKPLLPIWHTVLVTEGAYGGPEVVAAESAEA